MRKLSVNGIVISLVIFFGSGIWSSVNAQLQYLDLSPPTYIPSYNQIDVSTINNAARAINAQNDAALTFSREIFDVIHEYLPRSVDSQMRGELLYYNNKLEEYIEQSPRSKINQMNILLNGVRETINNGIERAKESHANALKLEDEFISNISSKIDIGMSDEMLESSIDKIDNIYFDDGKPTTTYTEITDGELIKIYRYTIYTKYYEFKFNNDGLFNATLNDIDPVD